MFKKYRRSVQGQDRVWQVYTPEHFSGNAPLPLLMALHGAGGPNIDRQSWWIEKSDREGFLLLLPEAFDETGWNVWNKDPGRPDDIAFLETLLRWASDHLPTDPTRIYLMGYSMGDMMASGFAFEHGDLLAAAALLVGPSLPSNLIDRDGKRCWKPLTSLPVLRVKGEKDLTSGFPSTHHVSRDAYDRALSLEEKQRLVRINHQIMKDFWIEINECNPVPRLQRTDRFFYEWYGGKNDFCFLSVKNAGHMLSEETCDPVWDFLKQYRKVGDRIQGKRPENLESFDAVDIGDLTISEDLRHTLRILHGLERKPTADLELEMKCLRKIKEIEEKEKKKIK